MLRSYLEKNDEFVNEEAFAKEMVQKFAPKLMESFPELWNEKVERIERLRAETNLNIKGKGIKKQFEFYHNRNKALIKIIKTSSI